jgi:hypothetical protein
MGGAWVPVRAITPFLTPCGRPPPPPRHVCVCVCCARACHLVIGCGCCGRGVAGGPADVPLLEPPGAAGEVEWAAALGLHARPGRPVGAGGSSSSGSSSSSVALCSRRSRRGSSWRRGLWGSELACRTRAARGHRWVLSGCLWRACPHTTRTTAQVCMLAAAAWFPCSCCRHHCCLCCSSLAPSPTCCRRP